MRVPVDVKRPTQTTASTTDLSKQLEQIVLQKGQFRHITEQSLLSEISKGQKPQEDSDEAQDDVNDETPEQRRERLWKQREEMQMTVNTAQQEVWSALDLVSFLLSKQSASARGSMSEYLQERAIVGTLDAKVVPPNSRSNPVKRQLNNVSGFWKSRAFASASDALSKASEELRLEANRESQFWDQVAIVKEAGWPVSRHPRDSRAIGVHFGIEESAPQFRNRAFALLRQSDDSRVYLDRPAVERRRKPLRVSVSRRGRRTATRLISSPRSSPASQIQDKLLEARDELFEEELLYEIGREARLLANQNITYRDNSVKITLESECDIEISRSSASIPETTASSDDDLAKFVAFSLQDLLIKAHDDNRRHRTRTPPPLSQRPPPTPEYTIIRPLTASLRHAAAVRELLRTWSSSLKAPSDAAGLDLSFVESQQSVSDAHTVDSSTTLPSQSSSNTFEFTLPSSKQVLVRVTTDLNHPTYGTVYDIPKSEFEIGRLGAERLTSLDTTMEALAHLIIVDVLDTTFSKANISKDSTTNVRVTNIYTGEIDVASSDANTKIRIGFANGSLILKALSMSSGSEKGTKQLLCSWSEQSNPITGDLDLLGMETAESISLSAVMEKLMM